MQRNFKNLVTMSVMVLSAVHTSLSYAGGKGGGSGSGAGFAQKSFSVNTNHNFQSQSSNSFHSTPAIKSFNSNLSANTLKTNSLSHLNTSTLHQVQIHNNNGIQPLVGKNQFGKNQIGKTPVTLNVGKNLQNLHVNQNTLHLNQKGLKLNTIHSNPLLSGNKNLLIGNKGIKQQFCTPFCSPIGNKCCSPCWKTFCTPSWWYNCSPCWSPWYCSCWSPFYPQFWSPCYSTCYSPCYSVGLPWLCSFGYYALGYGGTYAVPAGAAIDVELVDVRQIDAGDVQQQLGPAYRIAFRNNSVMDINQKFAVGAMATSSKRLSKEFPMAAVEVAGIRAGATVAVDIRLPLDAQRMGVNYMGQTVPFAYLYVTVDSYNQLNDSNRNNNSTFQGRTDILMADK